MHKIRNPHLFSKNNYDNPKIKWQGNKKHISINASNKGERRENLFSSSVCRTLDLKKELAVVRFHTGEHRTSLPHVRDKCYNIYLSFSIGKVRA